MNLKTGSLFFREFKKLLYIYDARVAGPEQTKVKDLT